MGSASFRGRIQVFVSSSYSFILLSLFVLMVRMGQMLQIDGVNGETGWVCSIRCGLKSRGPGVSLIRHPGKGGRVINRTCTDHMFMLKTTYVVGALPLRASSEVWTCMPSTRSARSFDPAFYTYIPKWIIVSDIPYIIGWIPGSESIWPCPHPRPHPRSPQHITPYPEVYTPKRNE